MPKKLFITNERMLRLMEWAVQTGIAENDSDWFEKIGFTRNNISKVRNGEVSFTNKQILRACTITGASADYIFGLTSQMMRKQNMTTIELMKAAIFAFENEYEAKKNSQQKRKQATNK